MRHTTKFIGASLALLALGSLSPTAHAQFTGTVTGAVSYDSINAPLNNGTLVTTQNGQQYLNGATGTQRAENGTQGAYNVLNTYYGPASGTPNNRNFFSSTNIGNGIASTTLLADDLHLQVSNAGFAAGSTLQSYSISSLGFALTNSNTTDLTVTAHIRVYDNNGYGNTIANGVSGNGDYAGTLLGAYDLSPVTLAGTGTTGLDSSITRLDALSSSTRLNLSGNQFQLMGNNYESTVWVGIFVTTNASTSMLNNVGYLAYDPNTANNDTSNITEQFDRGFSRDQLYGDRNRDFNNDGVYEGTYQDTFTGGRPTVTTAENSALANNGYNAARINPNTNDPNDTGVDLNGDRIRQLNQFSTGATGAYPQANLAWFIQGDATYVVPEPGSLGYVFAGMAPFGLMVLRRARRKSA